MVSEIKKIKNYKIFIKYIKPCKLRFIFLYLATILSNVADLFPIYFLGKIINYVTEGKFDGIVKIICFLFIIFMINSFFSIIETYLTKWLIFRINQDIKADIYKKSIELSIIDFNTLGSGHIISLIEGDSETISNFFVVKIVEVVIAIIKSIVSLFFLLYLSIPLTIIAIISFPIGFLGYVICGKKINIKTSLLRQLGDELYSFLNNSLDGIKDVKAYTMEQIMYKKFKNYIKRYRELNMEIAVLDIIVGFLNLFISSLTEWIIIGYGTWLIIYNKFTIGSYVAFNGFLATFFDGIKSILNINLVYQTVIASIDRISNFFDISIDHSNRSLMISKINGRILFDKVHFTYPNTNKKILSDFTATFEPKSLSVIVGLNGAGKSTLFSLIEQFYLPNNGNIYIDNNNIRNIDLDNLRKNISIVHQRPVMINGTIKENLLYGDINATIEKINQVCEKVDLAKFIEELPDRFDTILEELSGGQMKRIAIARALIKDPKILLMDEITSDLDGKNENEIMCLLDELSKEKTIIIISHRITSITNVPNIYVLDNGHIVDSGDHESLLKRCPIYSVLINNQS